MFCTQCGNKNDDNSKFCNTCGALLEVTPAVESAIQNQQYELPTNEVPTTVFPAQEALSDNLSVSGSPIMGSSNEQPSMNNSPYAQGEAPANYSHSDDNKRKKKVIITLIAAIIACVLVIGAGAWWYVNNARTAQSNNKTELQSSKSKNNKSKQHVLTNDDLDSDDEDSDTSSDKDNAIGASEKLNTKKINKLVNNFASNNSVSVAISGKKGILYESSNSRKTFPAVGFYFPVVLYTKDNPHHDYEDKCEDVIKTMSNDSANELLDDQGGIDGLDQWLSDNGYANTSFTRKYGDIDASNDGHENLTSSHDTAMMLSKAMQNSTIANATGYDISADGVNVPDGIEVMAHRGQGIKNVYNYFLILKKGKNRIGVSVLTKSADKDDVAEFVSKLLNLLKNNLQIY